MTWTHTELCNGNLHLVLSHWEGTQKGALPILGCCFQFSAQTILGFIFAELSKPSECVCSEANFENVHLPCAAAGSVNGMTAICS